MEKRMFCWVKALLLVLALGVASVAQSEQRLSWSAWVEGLRHEAVSEGISPVLFDEVFSDIKAPSKQVLKYDRSQPEKRLTFLEYRNTRAGTYRIKMGRKEMQKYKSLLNKISYDYGVNQCFIVSLWGLETSYGRFMGNFPVIQSLATLAYDARRAAFFRKQLLYALHILNEGHIEPENFKGEWAGASGQPQFLPSSWHDYAVDYNHDGRKDIWKTHSDVFASIANYLVQHGWKRGQPWGIAVKINEGREASQWINKKIEKSVEEWRAMGVKTLDGRPWPEGDLKAELIRPYGGPDMLIFNNFKVIMKWNRSTYYAGTVGYMAEQLCGRSL